MNPSKIMLTGMLIGTMQSAFAMGNEPSPVSTDVVVLTKPYCGWCKKIKVWFKDQNISYTEYDADSKEGSPLYAKYHGSGVPLTIINGKPVSGYNTAKIQRMVIENRFRNEQPIN